MKNNILLSIGLVILSCSCSVQKEFIVKNMVGEFYGIAEGFSKNTSNQYLLKLKEENLFTLEITGHDYRPKCEGTWVYKNEKIILKCTDLENIVTKLSNSYMNKREFIITVHSEDKLELDNMTLKRK